MKINSQTPIYNGLNIRQILNRMPSNLRTYKRHRNLYVKNCLDVFKMEQSGMNLSYAENVRSSNFFMIRHYLETQYNIQF